MTYKGWYAIKQRNQTKPNQVRRSYRMVSVVHFFMFNSNERVIYTPQLTGILTSPSETVYFHTSESAFSEGTYPE